MGSKLRLLTLTVVLPCLCVLGQQALGGSYHKTIYWHLVKAGAGISGGARAQTWRDLPLNKTDTVPIYQPPAPKKPIERKYVHAAERIRKAIIAGDPNEGLPIAPIAGKDVDTADPRNPAGTHSWYPATASIFTDGHNEPNSAMADIEVTKRNTTESKDIKVNGPNGIETKTLLNWVQGDLRGFAIAGAIADNCTAHSADSFAGVKIDAVNSWVFDAQHGAEVGDQIVDNVGVGGTISGPLVYKGGFVDPLFLVVNDIDTGELWVEELMRQTLEYSDATYSIDEDGIRMTINALDPDSYVDLDFTTEFDWVLNPYTYGARLDATGLTAYGVTPLSGWTVNTIGNTIEAYYDFGPDGKPLDYVQAKPPDSMFVQGHTYTYDSGGGGGVWEVTVPEPASLSVLAFGAIGVLVSTRRRSR